PGSGEAVVGIAGGPAAARRGTDKGHGCAHTVFLYSIGASVSRPKESRGSLPRLPVVRSVLYRASSHSSLNAATATRVGGMAEISSLRGLTVLSLKRCRRMDMPAGFGALAMTVSPPPVTAPVT